ncbi:MAG: ATP synthase F1 subunit delta [Bacteroidales bacterium]|nr:ATP synthase F1 subunit delta [Bacteroidales bacterium]
MDGGLIARRYATVLYEYGMDKNKTADIYDDVNMIRNAFADAPKALELLASPLKKASEKKTFLKSVFDGKVSAETSEFMSFVVDRGRVDMVDEILRVYQVVYKEHNGIKTAEVTTAKEITDAKKADFTKQLESKLGSKVEATFKADASIIGGIIIRVDGKQVDRSIARQLAEIEKKLTV